MISQDELHANLAPGLNVVESWPRPDRAEEYELRLTEAEHHLVWAFVWRNFGVAQLPVQVNECCDEQ